MSDDVVGYARPPKQFQFRKGQSGNPKGRPRRTANDIGDIVAGVVNGDVSYSEGDQRKVATLTEVSLRALLKHALTGDLGAAEEVLRVLLESRGTNDRDLTVVRVTGWLPEYPGQSAEERNVQTKDQVPPGAVTHTSSKDTEIERQT